MKKTTHLKEIAFELGLSINTVSRALRDCDDIAEKTKDKIRQKAFEMGYMPNTVSQFIKNQKKLIGIIADNLLNPYVCYQIQNISRKFQKIGYSITIILCDSQKIEKDVFKECLSERIDGIITFTTPSKEFLQLAQYNYLPVVNFGELGELSNLASSVCSDNLTGSMIAANYMTNKHKCRKFIYVGIDNYLDSEIRKDAIGKNLQKLLKNKDYVYKTLIMKDITASSFIELLKKGYNSVFCFNDSLAYDLIGLLNESIPNFRKVFPQFHIIGYDALCTKLSSASDITSIGFDYDSVVSTTLNILKKAFTQKGYIEHAVIPCNLHQRIN